MLYVNIDEVSRRLFNLKNKEVDYDNRKEDAENMVRNLTSNTRSSYDESIWGFYDKHTFFYYLNNNLRVAYFFQIDSNPEETNCNSAKLFFGIEKNNNDRTKPITKVTNQQEINNMLDAGREILKSLSPQKTASL